MIQAPSKPEKPLQRRGSGMQIVCGLLLALATLGVSSCHSAAYYYYKFPEYNYAGRPVPPSKLAQRVMIGVTANGSFGSLQIVDASRDIRNNVENTIPFYSISGYSSGSPGTILSFPSELRGYVYSNSDGSLTNINYSTESSSGSVGSFESGSSSAAVPPTFTRFYGAEEAAGILEVIDNAGGGSYALNLPNVYKVAVNKGDTVALAMVRNSNVLYRVFKLNQNQYPTQQAAIQATGSADCQPTLLPVYCVVSVPGVYDKPAGISFSLDGTTAYVLNCGPECGGNTASVTLLQQGPLNICVQLNGWLPGRAYALDATIFDPAGHIQKATTAGTSGTGIPTFNDAGGTTPDGAGSLVWTDQGAATTTPCTYIPSSNPVIANVPVPGGVTAALSDGTTLYLAGQSQNQIASNGTGVVATNHNLLFGGYLTTMNLATQKVTAAYPISDGNHSKMLFADNDTLWIGSQFCATGVRADAGQNYNCLTMVVLGGALPTPVVSTQIVPKVTPGSATAVVPYPNQNNNQYYYGSLTGLCWVENYNKVYTAYGGQVHIFKTVDGSEIDNQYVAVQGTALDVAYMDASTDDAN